MTKCHYCDREITFSDDPQYISKTGKRIPLEIDLAGAILGPHRCPALEQEYSIWKQKNAKLFPCRKCSDPIYFDEKQKTDSGKWIPIDKQTAAPHLCVQR